MRTTTTAAARVHATVTTWAIGLLVNIAATTGRAIIKARAACGRANRTATAAANAATTPIIRVTRAAAAAAPIIASA